MGRPKRRTHQSDPAKRHIEISDNGEITCTEDFPGVQRRIRGPACVQLMYDLGELTDADIAELRERGYLSDDGKIQDS